MITTTESFIRFDYVLLRHRTRYLLTITSHVNCIVSQSVHFIWEKKRKKICCISLLHRLDALVAVC